MPIEPTAQAGELLRVLVADDDPIQRNLIGGRLLRLNGQTVEAEDGVAAWALLSSQNFDMAIVDLGMPNLDGFGLIRCMRSYPRTRHMPIIVVTSRQDRDAIEQAMVAGASSFLIKPIAWSTFEHHIGFLLRMVQSAKVARTISQREIAAHRAREAVLGNLCGDAKATTKWIMEEVEAMRRLPLPATVASLVHEHLTAISNECRGLKLHAIRAAEAIADIAERIVVADDKRLLADVAAAAVQVVAAKCAGKTPTMMVALPEGSTWLSCDADAIQQALELLLENAVGHSPIGAEINVSGRLYPDGLLGIEVTDHGVGMHPDVFARSFAPLEARLDAAGGDIGYGLLIAKAIAEAHGGTLEVRSMPQQGTTVLLFLPPDRVTNIVANS